MPCSPQYTGSLRPGPIGPCKEWPSPSFRALPSPAGGDHDESVEEMRIQDQVAPLIVEAIRVAQREGDLPPFDLPAASAIPLERPKSDEHGDIATPVAMQLAREARRAPRQIAEALARRLPAGPGAMIASAEVAGTGFLNLRLAPAWLAARVDLVLAAGPAYANPRLGQSKRAQVEFVSANPTGPLTVGHGRGAVI